MNLKLVILLSFTIVANIRIARRRLNYGNQCQTIFIKDLINHCMKCCLKITFLFVVSKASAICEFCNYILNLQTVCKRFSRSLYKYIYIKFFIRIIRISITFSLLYFYIILIMVLNFIYME